MRIYYIENEIDYKYQVPFLKAIGSKLPQDLRIYYRKIPGLVDISDFVEYNVYDKEIYEQLVKNEKAYSTIPKLLKAMNKTEGESVLITGYNFKKRGIERYSNIKVVNIGHSISGNTVYNLRIWTEDNNENSISLVPSFFRKVKRPPYRRKKYSNGRIDTNLFYKLIYLLRETEAVHKDKESNSIPTSLDNAS